MLLSAVSTAAYALFTDTSSVAGMTVTAGNADLQISTQSSTTGFNDSQDFNNSILDDQVFPGYQSDNVDFWLKNNSQSDISLSLHAQMTSYHNISSGSWSALKDIVYIRVQNISDGQTTNWQSLDNWYTTGFDLPLALDQAQVNQYQIQLKVDSSATNAIKNKGLSNINFDIVATQVL